MGLILCNGYVTGLCFPKHKALIISCFLCDGYVTEKQIVKVKQLIINEFLCDGYVTEPANFTQYSSKFLFDWKTSRTSNFVEKPLFTSTSLFDGYLTEH